MENPDTKKDEVKAYRLSEYGFDDPFRPKNLRHLGLKMIEHYTDSYDIITSREVNKMFLVVHERILKKLDTEDFTLELANDENINVRNTGIKAVENNIINLSSDQRTFTWASNDRKLITVPFDENPYSALAAWFKTDEGIEVYQTIEKKLK